jgi:hypothetical protein
VMTLTWSDIEDITSGQLRRQFRTRCPFCDAGSNRVFSVKLTDDDFAVYNCFHCGKKGYVRSGHAAKRSPEEIAERKRQADIAEAAEKKADSDEALRTYWNDHKPFYGSLAERYLRITRRIDLDAFPRLDEVFGLSTDYVWDDTARGHRGALVERPCLVALVRNILTDEPQAVHRTLLTSDNPPQKITRLSRGPTAGGAIKLSPHDEVTADLLIGEGIETALSASIIVKLRPVWSVVSCSGIAKFPIIPGLERLQIAVDNDGGAGQHAAAECVERMTAAGIEVITHKPTVAKDFNDILLRAKS